MATLAKFCESARWVLLFLGMFYCQVLIKLCLHNSKRTNFKEFIVDLSIKLLKALKKIILNRFSSYSFVSTVAKITKVETPMALILLKQWFQIQQREQIKLH